MSDTNPVIVAISEEDIAKIKSSVTITNLADVICGLLCNSLDAESSKIHISVDFNRGSCVVEDDGVGISTAEFTEEGGLAKAYYTSKAKSIGLHGGYGTFLSSVGALALLTITSRQTMHRSANALTCHQSKPVSRYVPAPAQHDLLFSTYGTRVTVRNLFGNMPVRIKQRASLDSEVENNKEWKTLVRRMVALLMAWPPAVSVTLQDETAQRKLRLGGLSESLFESTRFRGNGVRPNFAERLHRDLNILTQAHLIESDSWSSWVPIAASTTTISIRGAISLDPAPTKQIQFMFLGIRPLHNNSDSNELYREINRIFSTSAFGVTDGAPFVDETEQIRRDKDRRFKQDGFTTKQVKGDRKGIDRWPMFFLQIEVKSHANLDICKETKAEDGVIFQSILSIIDAMVRQWLTEHHFQPHKLRHKKNDVETRDGSSLQEDFDSRPPSAGECLSSRPTSPSNSTLTLEKRSRMRPSSSNVTSRKKTNKRSRRQSEGSGVAGLIKPAVQTQSDTFRTWSRIKSGRSDFFDQLDVRCVSDTEVGTPFSQTNAVEVGHLEVPIPPRDPTSAPIDTALNASSTQSPQTARMDNSDIIPMNENDDSTDKFVNWRHPVTKEDFLLNTRSGLLLPASKHRTRFSTAASTGTETSELGFNTQQKSTSVRLEARQNTLHGTNTDWLTSLLKDWDNPVFQRTEIAIPQYSTELPFPDTQSRHACCYGQTRETASQLSSRLSVSGLRVAEIISQLDNKYILVKMPSVSTSTPGGDLVDEHSASMLVIIDQHAADERCKIEALLEELCTPYPPDTPACKSNLGYTAEILSIPLQKPIIFQTTRQEAELLRDRAAFFATWGVLYHISDPLPTTSEPAQRKGKDSRTTIISLPPGILERCMAEPNHIISIVRTEAWNATTSGRKYIKDNNNNDANKTKPAPRWHLRLSSCPPGILDLLNSRACRSAIMFNDALNKSECADLVARLANCVFPWQCAHGRPSVVPLVAFGGEGMGAEGRDECDEWGGGECQGGFGGGLGDGRGSGDAGGGRVGFVDAFRKWNGEV